MRGGNRPGAGRPPGTRNVALADLESWINGLESGDLLDRLSVVADDVAVPYCVRLTAMRYLFGAFSGRLRRTSREMGLAL